MPLSNEEAQGIFLELISIYSLKLRFRLPQYILQYPTQETTFLVSNMTITNIYSSQQIYRIDVKHLCSKWCCGSHDFSKSNCQSQVPCTSPHQADPLFQAPSPVLLWLWLAFLQHVCQSADISWTWMVMASHNVVNTFLNIEYIFDLENYPPKIALLFIGSCFGLTVGLLVDCQVALLKP